VILAIAGLLLLVILGAFIAVAALMGRARRARLLRDAERAAAKPPDRRDPWKEAGKRMRVDEK
jgi:hypothetical protein